MRAILLLPLAILGAALAPAADLTVGSKAPELKVAKWVKGEPIAAFEPGKVYVVEFWATWCGPCKVSIPHLTELQKKYEGKVAFTGVSILESNDEDFSTKVPQFVQQMGDKMNYRVAVDNASQGTMFKTWFEAAGERGIPSSFIVDQKGEIAWIGHPMVGLDETLGQVLAGTWDKAKFAQEFKAKQEADAKFEAFQKEFVSLRSEPTPDKALALIDRTIPQVPQYAGDLAMMKWSILAQSDEKKAYAYASEAAAGFLKNDPMSLNMIAWTIVDSKKLKTPDYALALKIAKQASALLKENDAMVLDTVAFAYFKTGDKSQAIATEKKAIELATSAKMGDDVLQELKGRLAEFEKA